MGAHIMSRTILIVDDSKLARKVLRDALPDRSDWDISEVSNGLEALEFSRRNTVDILFLDLTMPEMDGYELLEKLQTEKIRPFVIVVSADIQPKARERVISLGAATFVSKPVDADEIYSCLQEQGLL